MVLSVTLVATVPACHTRCCAASGMCTTGLSLMHAWVQASGKQSLLVPRNLSSIIWAWGTFGHAPAAMALLLEAAEARMQQHNDQDVANLMSGLAACERPDLATPGLMSAAEQHACSIAASFSPQVLPSQSYGCIL